MVVGVEGVGGANSDVVSRTTPQQHTLERGHELHHNNIHSNDHLVWGGRGGLTTTLSQATPQQHPLECDHLMWGVEGGVGGRQTAMLCHDLRHNSIPLNVTT